MNDINEMPPKCQYCPYWEVCEYPWVCQDRKQLVTKLQPTCHATDTISRQAALDALNKLDVSDGVEISSVACDLQKEAIRSIENLPSAQPEIVKCKDCKHYGCILHSGTQFEYGECFGHEESDYIFEVKPDDYCSRAERRTDE